MLDEKVFPDYHFLSLDDVSFLVVVTGRKVAGLGAKGNNPVYVFLSMLRSNASHQSVALVFQNTQCKEMIRKELRESVQTNQRRKNRAPRSNFMSKLHRTPVRRGSGPPLIPFAVAERSGWGAPCSPSLPQSCFTIGLLRRRPALF